MDNLKHVHTVKTGIQPLIALIIGGRMKHLVIDHLVIIPVQHLAKQIKLRLQPFRKASQASHKIMIQTVSHIQSQTIDIKFFYPAFDTVQDMIDYLFMAQI